MEKEKLTVYFTNGERLIIISREACRTLKTTYGGVEWMENNVWQYFPHHRIERMTIEYKEER